MEGAERRSIQVPFLAPKLVEVEHKCGYQLSALSRSIGELSVTLKELRADGWVLFLNSLECFLNVLQRVSQNYRPAVGTGHGTISFGQLGQQPFHFILFQ